MEKDKNEENKNLSSEADESKTQLDIIAEGGGVVTKNSRETIHCLSIIGHIEGHYSLTDGQKATKYEQLLPLLVAIEEDEKIEGVLILLNTVGGDVEAGLAIAELIASLNKPTVSLVLGGGHSIGEPLAVSADRAFIVPSATMTIHPVRTTGLVVGVPQTFFYFEKMQDRIIEFVASHSKISKEKLHDLMMATDQLATDVGSVIDGKEAVKIGLIDEIGGLSDALEALREMIAERKLGRT